MKPLPFHAQFVLPKTGRVVEGLPIHVVPISGRGIADGVPAISDELTVVHTSDNQVLGTLSDSEAAEAAGVLLSTSDLFRP